MDVPKHELQLLWLEASCMLEALLQFRLGSTRLAALHLCIVGLPERAAYGRPVFLQLDNCFLKSEIRMSAPILTLRAVPDF